jgi:MFS family permease
MSRTVQEYIDETPQWRDGTAVADVPLTSTQWTILGLATAGKFFEGMVVFMTGVALPLIALEFALTSAQKGFIAAATLGGILVGASLLGGLADRVGRKRMFWVEMVLFTIFLILTALSPNFFWLVVFLFGIGVALGCDYPTAHLVLSESIPSRMRGRLVLGAFGFQAVGALVGTVIGFLVLRMDGSIADWRWMYAIAVVPAGLVAIGRLFLPESSHWLLLQGRRQEAKKALAHLLRRNPPYPKELEIKDVEVKESAEKVDYWSLFKKPHRKATILASLPWFFQDLGTYGIGIFTPTILAATIGATSSHERNLAEVVHNDLMAVKGAAGIDVLLLVGIVAAVLLVDRIGRIKLQIWGFIGCAVGLGIAASSSWFTGTMQIALIFAGFMLFNFMTNMGPNAMTYLLAGEVFPTKIRGAGAGLAASIGKVGAVVTAFLFPILLHEIGTGILLGILVVTSLLGAWVTWRFSIETRGINLETIGETT